MARPHNRSLPLNIKGNRDHLFVRVLTEARSQAIKNAREWPIAVAVSIAAGMAASMKRDAMILADREPYINVIVPTIMPSVVRRDRSRAIARPKSPIWAMPSSVNHTLPGFK